MIGESIGRSNKRSSSESEEKTKKGVRSVLTSQDNIVIVVANTRWEKKRSLHAQKRSMRWLPSKQETREKTGEKNAYPKVAITVTGSSAAAPWAPQAVRDKRNGRNLQNTMRTPRENNGASAAWGDKRACSYDRKTQENSSLANAPEINACMEAKPMK